MKHDNIKIYAPNDNFHKYGNVFCIKMTDDLHLSREKIIKNS